ncbi:MAG: BtpA/SgcQ family protein [Phycisphaerae bacterium]
MTAAGPDSPATSRLFARRPVLIGMVHLPALPGAIRHTSPLDQIIDQATRDASLLAKAGFTAVLVENFGDQPFLPETVAPHTVAAMSIVVRELCRRLDCPVGLSVLRNDALAAVAIAAVAGADFIRVNIHTGVYATDQGLIQGRAAQTLRYRRELASDLAILADVHVKHAQPLSSSDPALAAAETAYRGLADALVLTGPATGQPVDPNDLATVRHAVPDRPVLVGSGVTPENLQQCLAQADGVIVGTSLKRDGRTENPLDPRRLDHFIQCARQAR